MALEAAAERPGRQRPDADDAHPLLAGALFIELSIAVLGTALRALDSEGPTVQAGFGSPAAIGELFLERFLIAFEAASLLLLIAAVGAVVLAGRREEQGEA